MSEKVTNHEDVVNDIIPGKLPLLEYISQQYGIEDKQCFNGYKILAVQHLLGSTVPLFSMLERGGAKPEDVHIVGKAYSSHPKIVSTLSRSGYHVAGEVFRYSEDQPYDSVLEENIEIAFNEFIEDDNFAEGETRGLLIDDGGKAVRMLHERYPHLARKFTAVEQTSRGARVIESLSLMTPVINVARSEAKTRIESPLIGKSMVDEFKHSLDRWGNALSLRNNMIFLLGYGFVGENVASELERQGYSIAVYDPSEDKRAKAESDGYMTISDHSEGFRRAGTVVGCTGTPSITAEELQNIIPGTLLVSMASTDTEFSAWNLRPNGHVVHTHKLPSDFEVGNQEAALPWRSLYQVDLGGTTFYLANGGFPIDFSGSIDPIDPQKIQLTRGLLLGAAVQAVGTTSNGFFQMNQEMQEKIINEYVLLQQ